MNPLRFAIVLLATVPAIGTAAVDDCKLLERNPIIRAFVPQRIVVKPRFVFGTLKDVLGFPEVPPGLTIQPVGPDGALQIDSTIDSTEKLRERFSDPTRYESVEEDVYIEAHGHGRVEPNDQFFASPATRWWLDAIHAPEAWTRGSGDIGIVVAVVDSGIQADHCDLDGNVFVVRHPFHLVVSGRRIDCQREDDGFDAVEDDCKAEPRTEHGTEVAGIIGARGDNGLGTTGVNWDVTLLPVTLLDEKGSCATRAVRALEFVRMVNLWRRPRVRVVNLSWGAGRRSRRLEKELMLLAADNIVIVASAGNDGKNNDCYPVFPASYRSIPTLISVAATGPDRALLSNSDFGEASVDIAAPGLNIVTTSVSEPFDNQFSKTSAAAPFVSGGVALIASQCPDLSAIELRDMILRNADDVPQLDHRVNGGHFLNLERASDACEAWKRRTAASQPSSSSP